MAVGGSPRAHSAVGGSWHSCRAHSAVGGSCCTRSGTQYTGLVQARFTCIHRQTLYVHLLILWLILLDPGDCKRGSFMKSSEDLLDKEALRLEAEKISCSLDHSELTTDILNNLRLLNKDDAVACHVSYLIHEAGNGWTTGWVWSGLGDMYLKQGTSKSNSLATTCFKQAIKHAGKLPHVRTWNFIGPFVIGKSEVDGDPVEFYGGIRNITKYRLVGLSDSYLSEMISPDGMVSWIKLPQKQKRQIITIAPPVNWNHLVAALGSTAITEWQGWLISEFIVNEKNMDVLIRCLGVHTIYIDDVPITGDVYRREWFWFAVNLNQGIHNVFVRLRAKGTFAFECQFKVAAARFEVLAPHYLPDLYDGHLFGSHLAIPLANHHPSRWLRNIRVSLESQSEGVPLTVVHSEERNFAIAPGQVRPFTVKLESESDPILSTCHQVGLGLKLQVSTSEGSAILPLTIRCRTRQESVLFTFVDHDGSVQHAAVIHPIQSCPSGACPVVLTMHGTTVPPQNQADSYKRMVNGKFLFGFDRAWLLAPTRHGAHNWEGPGALTVLTALETLVSLVQNQAWITEKASARHVIFAGHSMGGHGAWHLATHFPDITLAVVSLAGWIRKETYGDSNLLFRHDVGQSSVDPSVKAILEACIAENEPDRLASNLAGIPVLLRVGANDQTVHPWHVRRMHRILKEWKINATYVELQGKEHWWWDTSDSNDGGVVHDPQVRHFTDSFAHIHSKMDDTCDLTAGGCLEDGEDAAAAAAADATKYLQPSKTTVKFTYTVVNPAFGGPMHGIKVLQQTVPFRTSTIQCELKGDSFYLQTVNVARFQLTEPLIRKVGWKQKTIVVDNALSIRPEIVRDKSICLVKDQGSWYMMDTCNTLEKEGQRGPLTLGPARRVAEGKYLIIIGSQVPRDTQKLQEFAVYVANLFFLTSDSQALVIQDKDLHQDVADKYNLIVIGDSRQNIYTEGLLKAVPLQHEPGGSLQLGQCAFSHTQTGVVFLAPHADRKLALVLMGNSMAGLSDVVSMATPTIPPMTRSPFSNLIPDYLITGPEFRGRGAGGYLCAGFWGNKWDWRPELASCSYC